MNTLLMFLGLALIAAGIVVLFSSQKKLQNDDLIAQIKPEKDVQIKGGAVIMIGPIPIVIGSDSRIALIMMLMALAIIVIWAIGVKS